MIEAAGLSTALMVYSNGLAIWSLRRKSETDTLFAKANPVVLALLAGYARLRFEGAGSLGLGRQGLGKSLGLGLALGLGLSGPPLLFFYSPVLLDTPLEYGPVSGMSRQALLEDLFVRLPVGVALVEELAFRGLLYGLLRKHHSSRVAILWSAAAFAGWHIAVTARSASQTNLTDAKLPGFLRPYIQPLSVVGGMLSTGIAGALFGLIREYTGNLAGPIVAHWLVDGLMVAALWLRPPGRGNATRA